MEESPDWKDGILLTAATLESATTRATLGAEGVRKPSPMANLDFVSYPLGEYTMNNIKFVEGIKEVPKIYSNNYFMRRPDGSFVTSKLAKKVWLHWAEGRIHNEYDAYQTPTGKIPKYEDLRKLFKQVLNKEYSKEDYIKQFTIRVPENLAKLDRVAAFYREEVTDVPAELFQVLDAQRSRLLKVKATFGDYVSPENLQE